VTITIDPVVTAAMRAHAVEGWPEEVCGAVLEGPEGPVVRRMTNVQNRLHAADPSSHPRDARTAYSPEPRELFEVTRQGGQPGWRIAIFYHSHPQHGSYFSDTDKREALWGDPGDPEAEPNYPGVAWVVLSVYDREVRDLKAFAWDEATRDFAEIPLR
jgi:proteasome lid subunit RPN8/RPN11